MRSVDSLGEWDGFNLIIESVLDHSSVSDLWLVERVIKESQSMLAPFNIVTLSKVVSSVGTTRFFSVFGCEHGHLGLNHQIVKFESFNKVGIPNVSSVSDTNILNFC